MRKFVLKKCSIILLLYLAVLSDKIEAADNGTYISVNIFDDFYVYSLELPIYVKVQVKDSNNIPVSSFSDTVFIEKISGPGVLSGDLFSVASQGKAEFKNMYVTAPGIYQVNFYSDSIQLQEYLNFTVDSGNWKLTSGGAKKTYFIQDYFDTTYVSTPFTKYILAIDDSGRIDTAYTGNVKINYLSGPGNFFGGGTKIDFNKGICLYKEMRFDSAGSYQIVTFSSGLIADTTSIIVVDKGFNSTSSGCNIEQQTARKNQGIYGGNPYGLTYCLKNNRIFAAVETPYSLFASDDTGASWYKCFPFDSLEFECGERGWGGRGIKVLTNNKGVVLVLTDENYGKLSASVINHNEGDTGKWHTFVDNWLLEEKGYEGWNNRIDIGLSDYYAYSVAGPNIIMQDTLEHWNVIDVRDHISGINTKSTINQIATANTSNGLPFYIMLDTTDAVISLNSMLYKYDGVNFSELPIPVQISNLTDMHTLPLNSSADTLFIVGTDSVGSGYIFRSDDGGNSWNSIYAPQNPYSEPQISVIKYNPSIKRYAIIYESVGVSWDLGETWDSIKNTGRIMTYSPLDTGIVWGNYQGLLGLSHNGLTGSFDYDRNKGLEGIIVYDISRNEKKNTYFLATNAGLAYTKAYNSSLLNNLEEQWINPVGEFPILSAGIQGFTAVSINPWDTLNIIAANEGNVFVTESGADYFMPANPIGFNNDFYPTQEIEFVNDSLVLLVKGSNIAEISDSIRGGIWRSTDKGSSWTNVSPVGFYSGSCVAIMYGNDTTIFVGEGSRSLESGSLWQSTDMGISWNKINDGLDSQRDTSFHNMGIFDIEIGTNILYIGGGYFSLGELAVSVDSGKTFSYIPISDDTYSEVTDLHFEDNGNNDSLYMASGKYIYLYDVNKDSISLIYRGIPGDIIRDMENGSLLCGTSTGFYSLELETVDDIIVPENYVSNNNDLSIFPNPTNGNVILQLSLNQEIKAEIAVYDIVGKKQLVLEERNYEIGKENIILKTANFKDGTYFIVLHSENKNIVKKLVVLK